MLIAMIQFIKNILSCSRYTPLLMSFIALSALSMALIGQYMFGLLPCNLCLIQRYPYGIVIFLGIVGFLFSFKCHKARAGMMGLIGLTFLANSVIAFYHSGVELKWWKSFLEGCNVPDFAGDINDIMNTIKNTTEIVRCDEIAWADPLLGLSMANYNVGFCLVMGIIALYAMSRIWKKGSCQSASS